MHRKLILFLAASAVLPAAVPDIVKVDTGQLRGAAMDGVVAFKGVFLEGLEVVIIVLTLGASSHRLGLAVVAATTAVLVVGAIGVVVARQLSRVPENAMKMSVGVALVTYGTFWTGEGLKVRWPGNDLMLLVFIVLYAALTWLLVLWTRRTTAPRSGALS